jgi:hypothetical protein
MSSFFRSRVDPLGPVPSHSPDLGPCWMWLGRITRDGYGCFHGRGAHRYTFSAYYGFIPPGLCVLHRCDVPACVRPSHLFLGTHVENSADARRKGRLNIAGVAKLREEDALLIREAAAAGFRLPDLAEVFGVNAKTVRSVVKFHSWKDIYGISA